MNSTDISNFELLGGAPLADLILEVGKAVAHANSELERGDGQSQNTPVCTVNSAEVEMKVAISINKERTGQVGIGGALMGFNVNASYASTYGFKQEASSTIKVTFAVKPLPPPASPPAPGPPPASPPAGDSS